MAVPTDSIRILDLLCCVFGHQRSLLFPHVASPPHHNVISIIALKCVSFACV